MVNMEKLLKMFRKKWVILDINTKKKLINWNSILKKKKKILANENEFEILRRVEIESKVKDTDEQNNFLRKELENVQKLSKDVNYRLREAHQELEDSHKKHTLIYKKKKRKNRKN